MSTNQLQDSQAHRKYAMVLLSRQERSKLFNHSIKLTETSRESVDRINETLKSHASPNAYKDNISCISGMIMSYRRQKAESSDRESL